MKCFRAPEFKQFTRLKALQSAAVYYVLYHTQHIWNASMGKLPPDLLPDLFLYNQNQTTEWNGDDLFEYLPHTKDRSEPVASPRFLSYIAPYWFWGDSDSAIRFRPSWLQTLQEFIDVLVDSQMLVPATLTNCVLCVGAAINFPLHPEGLIGVDKRPVHSLTR